MDLLLAAILLFSASALIFWAIIRLCRHWPRRFLAIPAALFASATAIFAIYYLDSPEILRILPVSGAVILGNLLLPLIAGLVAVAWRAIRLPRRRKAVVCGGLAAMAAMVTFRSLLAPTPKTQDQWTMHVAIQSSSATCSPSAAATFLAHFGIHTGETEMAHLCLTTSAGTSLHGLYRGLCQMIQGKPYRVEVVTGDLDTLRHVKPPVLLNVGIRRGQVVDPRYTEKWGWIPGVDHTVVFEGFLPNDRALIADPSVGPEAWNKDSLQTLWHGMGLMLVPNR